MSDPAQVTALTERAFVPPQANGRSGIPDGIVVLMRDTCPHCHSSMEATNYATRTANGVPVTWVNLNDERAARQLMALGIPFDTEEGRIYPREVAGKAYEGVPSVIRTEQGQATDLMHAGAFTNEKLNELGALVEAHRSAEKLRSSALTDAPETLSIPNAVRSGQIQLG
ncbi:MAG: hypothetical protein DI582_07085 [Azospirillum brasilense]|nr:MAG: hypothetical protein DI582_07085 [Azospirillum brasilense]